LFWSPEFEYAELDIRNMTHEKGRLGKWMATVPAPPPHDHHAPRPKEVDAALKSLSKPTRPERPAREARQEPAE
jgi:NADH-quinone oxidoreductase subunit I